MYNSSKTKKHMFVLCKCKKCNSLYNTYVPFTLDTCKIKKNTIVKVQCIHKITYLHTCIYEIVL